MLYPLTTLDSVPIGPVPIQGGSAFCVPFTLQAMQRLDIEAVQATDDTKQDFSLRAWVSIAPLGPPDDRLPIVVRTWSPNRARGANTICYYDRNTVPDSPLASPSDPGRYFLNILNMTNSANQFALTIRDTTDRDPT